MAITYVWNIDLLETKPTDGDLTDVVAIAHWSVTGTDEDTNTTSVNRGTASFGAASADNFTAFDSLTLDQVKGWVLDAMSNEDNTAAEVEQAIQANIASKINKQLNPPIVSRTSPWSDIPE